MTGSKAFTLVELLVYTVLFSLLMIGMIGFFQTIYASLRGKNNVVIDQLHNALALDMIKRDCMSASFDPVDWDVERGVFKKYTLTASGSPTSSSIGWQMRKGRLCRIEGVYDGINHRWAKRSVSAIKGSIQALQLQPVRASGERHITHVRIRFTVDAPFHSNLRTPLLVPRQSSGLKAAPLISRRANGSDSPGHPEGAQRVEGQELYCTLRNRVIV